MKIKVKNDEGEMVVTVDGHRIPVLALAIEAAEGENSLLHLVLENCHYELELGETQVTVQEPDTSANIAAMVRDLPAAMVEAAAMDQLGMDDSNVIQNVLGVVATIIEQYEGGHSETQHECADEGAGLNDAGSYFDLPSSG